MRCLFNIQVEWIEWNSHYQDVTAIPVCNGSDGDVEYQYIITKCIKERCPAWVDVHVGDEKPKNGGMPYREAVLYAYTPIIEKRCARLVNPADIVTK